MPDKPPANTISRREVLAILGGSALWTVACGTEPETTGCAPTDAPTPDKGHQAWHNRAPDPKAAEALLPWLFQTPADKLVAGVVQRLNAGLGYRDLIAAMLAATVTPDPLEMHKRAQIFAAHQLGRRRPGLGDVPLMYALLRLKEQLATWSDAGPPPLHNAPSVEQAPGALRDALLAWDEGGANRAAAVLCRAGKPGACGDALFEAAARNHHWIGHTTIDVSQTLRTLAFSGWFRAEAAIRALNAALCKPDVKEIDDFAGSVALVKALPKPDPSAAVDDAQALKLVISWRETTPSEAQDTAVVALKSGNSVATLWQAYRIAAAELTLRYPYEGWIKYAMHAVTTNNALRYAFDTTGDERLRGILLLQSVAFLQRIRLRCVGHGGEPKHTDWHIDKLASVPHQTTSLDRVIEAGKTDRSTQIAAALGWLQSCGNRPALISRFVAEAMPRILEEHQVKHPAAAFEEAELAGKWADPLAACAFHYGVEWYHAQWLAYDQTVDALGDLQRG